MRDMPYLFPLRCSAAALLILLSCCVLLPPAVNAAEDASTDTDSVAAEDSTDTVAEEAATPKVAVIRIAEMIDEWQARYVNRAIDDAIAQDVDYIVAHIDTYGGRVDSAEQIFSRLLSLNGPEDPRCIAFIDLKAISAGALIAFAHHEIHLTSVASIGDIGVIFQDSEGNIQYAPEKFVSPLRAQLIKASELRGWDAAWLQKMTDRNQKLYKVIHDDDTEHYVIEENLEPYLSQHPDDIESDDEDRVILILGEDRLVTKTAHQAVELNIATSVVNSLDDVYANLGVTKADVIDLNPTTTENVARTLGGWAPLLLSATILLIMLELKTSGVGLFAGLAAVTGTLFFICNYYQDLASYFEIVLILVGLLLISIELFTMIGGGFIALLGGITVMSGVFLAFMPETGQFDFDNPMYGDYVSSAAMNSLLTIFVMTIGFILFIIAAPRLPIFQRLAVQATVGGTSEAKDGSDSLIGQTATALSQLRPSGTVRLRSGKSHSATVKHGAYVAEGAEVIIRDHRYGDLIVEAKHNDDVIATAEETAADTSDKDAG